MKKYILYSYFSKILTRGSNKLHFIKDFVVHLLLQSTTQQFLPKRNMKQQFTILRNGSLHMKKWKKCFSSHVKIKLIRNLVKKPFLRRRIKKLVSYKMNTFLVPIDKLVWSKNKTECFFTSLSSGIDLIKNEKVGLILSFRMRICCIFY